ncbi:MAG TPA: carbohydrate ABC transporter permease [Bacilli bacterium]|nr:carbohydrate ABC transporter permease [Bacilli bacterium]
MTEKMNVKNLEKSYKVELILKNILVYGFLGIMAIIVVVPFYWMIISALKTQAETEMIPPTLFPQLLNFQNFPNAMMQADFARYIYNTIFVGVVSTVGTVVTTIFAAFAFARLEFKGKNILFTLFLATMMIPGEMMVITNYITVARLGWIDTYQALIIPFVVSVFYIYLLRQNFKQIPNELYLAAKVDGTGDFKYLLRVMVPIAMPTIISITILKLIGSWNAYIWPNLVADSDSMRLITNGLRKAFTDDQGRSQIHLQMAATTVVTVPLLLVFLFLRKYIMQGVSRSGIKG